MTYLPNVIEAQYIRDYIIRVHFDDGTVKSVDISQWFKGPVFDPIRDIDNFRKFVIEAGALTWPTGVDLAPEALYLAKDVQKAA